MTELQQLKLQAGDPEAVALWEAAQHVMLGAAPLAGRSHCWPDELAGVRAGTGLVTVDATSPIAGWRVFRVANGRLVSPFLDPAPAADRALAQWKRGTNSATTRWCNSSTTAHPAPTCSCGIRVVQSLLVAKAIARHLYVSTGHRIGAVAEVHVWGRVAGPAFPVDWRYTARGRFARLAGPIHLARAHASYAADIRRQLEMDVHVDSDEVRSCLRGIGPSRPGRRVLHRA
jgi:hypothetical protein